MGISSYHLRSGEEDSRSSGPTCHLLLLNISIPIINNFLKKIFQKEYINLNPNNIMLPSVDEIKRRRKKSDLTQKQLATISGVSQSVIAKIESKKLNPSYSIFEKIFTALETLEKKEIQRAKDILSTKVICVKKDDHIKRAISIMEETNYSQLPVIDKDKIIGSITEKTIVDLMVSGQDLSQILIKPVEKVMDETFPRISEDTPVTAVSALLQDSQAVLVTKRDKIVGIITKSDLFKTTKV